MKFSHKWRSYTTHVLVREVSTHMWYSQMYAHVQDYESHAHVEEFTKLHKLDNNQRASQVTSSGIFTQDMLTECYASSELLCTSFESFFVHKNTELPSITTHSDPPQAGHPKKSTTKQQQDQFMLILFVLFYGISIARVFWRYQGISCRFEVRMSVTVCDLHWFWQTSGKLWSLLVN